MTLPPSAREPPEGDSPEGVFPPPPAPPPPIGVSVPRPGWEPPWGASAAPPTPPPRGGECAPGGGSCASLSLRTSSSSSAVSPAQPLTTKTSSEKRSRVLKACASQMLRLRSPWVERWFFGEREKREKEEEKCEFSLLFVVDAI